MFKSFYQYVNLSGTIFKWNKQKSSLQEYKDKKPTNSELKDIVPS